MKQIIIIALAFFSLNAYSQTLYIPPSSVNTDSLKLAIQISNVVRSIHVADLIRTRVSLAKHSTDSTLLRGLISGSGFITSSALNPYLTSANAASIYQPIGSYLTSYTETDPAFLASAASSITNTSITNWNTAFGWGNHALAGYLTSSSLAPYLLKSDSTIANRITANTTAINTNTSSISTNTSNIASNTTAIGNKADKATTISINGVTQDLSQSRTFTVASGSGSSSTIDSSKAFKSEPMLVSIPVGSTLRHFGDSYSTTGYPFFVTVDSLAVVTSVYKSGSGSPTGRVIDSIFVNEAPFNDSVPSTVMVGLNDIHVIGNANSPALMEKIKGSYRAIIANHYLGSAKAANDASITASGTWTTATSGSLYEKAANSLGGLARISGTSGASLTYTSPVTDNIVIGTFGSDSLQQNDGAFTVSVDGVVKTSFTANGKNSYRSASLFNATQFIRSHNLVTVTGLSTRAHQVVITATDARPVVVDYVGTLRKTNVAPLIIGSIPKVASVAYSGNAPSLDTITDNTTDSANASILAAIGEFSQFNFPIAYVDVNKYLSKASDFNTDSIHPNTSGQNKIARAFIEHFSEWPKMQGLYQTGLPTQSVTLNGSSFSAGILNINAAGSNNNGIIRLNQIGGKVLVNTSTQSSPDASFTVNGAMDLNGGLKVRGSANGYFGSGFEIFMNTSTHAIIDNYDRGGSGFNYMTIAAKGLGINKAFTTPDASAQLDVSSTTQGFLPPRMTKAQRDAIASPANGLTIWQTDNTPGLRSYNGTNWMKFTETAD